MDTKVLALFAAIIAASSSCQDPWSIESSMIRPGSLLNFKNSSSVGQYESLTWNWVGLNGDVWENRIWYSKHDINDIGGSFLYKSKNRNKKNTVALNWEKKDENFNCKYDSNVIKQPGWRISVRDVIEVNFIPAAQDWVFKIGEDQLFGTGVQSLSTEDYEEEYYEERRHKRSPQGYDESEYPTEAGFGSWIQDIINFFFGDGNLSRNDRGEEGIFTRFGNWISGIFCDFHGPCGRPTASDPPGGSSRSDSTEGIFTRLGNWMRGISCSWHGPCDRPVPSDPPEGPFPRPSVTPPTIPSIPATSPPPPVTPPSFNPEAEVLPELNNV